MLFRKALGYVLSEYRHTSKLTLRQIVNRGSGRISYNYLWELEQGRKEASSEMLDELASCLCIDTADLVIKVGIVMAGGVPNYLPKELDEQLVDL